MSCVVTKISHGFILRSLFFIICIKITRWFTGLNETGSYICADFTCIFYQNKHFEKIEKVLNKEYLLFCEWFIDSKLWIHFGDDKRNTIFFLSKNATKTENTTQKLISNKAQHCRICRMLTWSWSQWRINDS